MKQTDEHQDRFVPDTHAALGLQASPLRIIITGDDSISISIPVVFVKLPQAIATQDLSDPVNAPRLVFLPPGHPSITAIPIGDGSVTPERLMQEVQMVVESPTPHSSRQNSSRMRRLRFAVIAVSICFLLTLITLAVLSKNYVVLAVIWTSVLSHPKIHAS